MDCACLYMSTCLICFAFRYGPGLADEFHVGEGGFDPLGEIVRPKSTPPVKSASLDFITNGTDSLSQRPKIRFSIDCGVGSQRIVDPLSQYAMHSCPRSLGFRTEPSPGTQPPLVKVTICIHPACGGYASKLPLPLARRRSLYQIQCTQFLCLELELTPSPSHQPRLL